MGIIERLWALLAVRLWLLDGREPEVGARGRAALPTAEN